MDVSRPSRLAAAGLFLAMVSPFGFAQGRRASYDPASQPHSSKREDGFVDFTVKRINPLNRDYGQCLDEGRKVLLGETIKNGYYWSNVTALGFLGCLFIIIVYQHGVQTRRAATAAEALGQYERALSRANVQVEEATKRNHGLTEDMTALKELALHSQSPPTEAANQSTVRQARSRVASTQASTTAELKNGAAKLEMDHKATAAAVAAPSQIGLFKPEVDLVTKVNALQQQLSRSEEREKLLRRQLNEAGRKLQAEQERNRSLKGE